MNDRNEADAAAARLSAMEADLAALRAENARLRELLGLDRAQPGQATAWRPTLFTGRNRHDRLDNVDHESSPDTKVALFRELFAGRTDVYARRWENDRTGKAGWSPSVRGGWSNSRQPHREYLPFTDEVVEAHLAGRIHPGLYPLLLGDTCRLLACDFDGPGGSSMRWRITTRRARQASPSRWSDRVRGTVGTYGRSSPMRFPPQQHVGSVCICFGRP